MMDSSAYQPQQFLADRRLLHNAEHIQPEERTSRVRSVPIASGVSVDLDMPVRMRDGVQLMANVYRPMASSPAAVLLSVTPYSKDATPDLWWCRRTRAACTSQQGMRVCSPTATPRIITS